MNQPTESDFEIAVTDGGVRVTFKPTNSVFSFYRLADTEDIARVGPTSLANVRHSGRSGDTEDYPADKVQAMAERLAVETAKTAWSVQNEEEIDKSGPAIISDNDVIE